MPDSSSEAHPSVAQALDDLLRRLEAQGKLQCLVGRREIVEALSRRLDELGLLFFDDHVAVALVLEEAGWSLVDDSGTSHARAVTSMDEARLVADYLRVVDAEEHDRAPRPLADYLPLAKKILAAQARRAV